MKKFLLAIAAVLSIGFQARAYNPQMAAQAALALVLAAPAKTVAPANDATAEQIAALSAKIDALTDEVKALKTAKADACKACVAANCTTAICAASNCEVGSCKAATASPSLYSYDGGMTWTSSAPASCANGQCGTTATYSTGAFYGASSGGCANGSCGTSGGFRGRRGR